MHDDLLNLVQLHLLPQVEQLGLKVVEHEESSSFDNASVVLQTGDVRVRIVRERSVVFADLGSVAEPRRWFDSSVVMDYLGLSEEGGFHDSDAAAVLLGVSRFLTSCWQELSRAFGLTSFPTTRKKLQAVLDARAEKRFPV